MGDLFSNLARGQGEFQLHGTHVVASVEVANGLIHRVEFSSGDGEAIEEGKAVARRLVGQPISSALAIKAEQVTATEERSEVTLKTALLEAFHRAIEVCIEEE